METKYDFHQQNNKDSVKEAEQKCFDYLTGEGKEVINVANNPKYYKYGIDLIVKEPNNDVFIDVKADTYIHKTENIFYELIECFWENKWDVKFGWGLNKYLHYIYYVDIKNWILYIIPKVKLHSFIYSKKELNCRLIPHQKYKTIGFLIPLAELNFITTVIL